MSERSVSENNKLWEAAEKVAEEVVAAKKAESEAERQKQKKRVVKLILLMTLIALIIVFASIAWFAMNKAVSADTMAIQAKGDAFTIEPIDNAHVGIYDDDNKPLTYVRDKLLSDAEKGSDVITWQITDDVAITEPNNQTTIVKGKNIGNGPAQGYSGGISPGSSGELQFKLTPGSNGDSVNASFLFYLYAYTGGYNSFGDEDKTMIEIIDSTSSNDTKIAQKLLNGHILLFENKTNGKYSGLISSNAEFERLMEKSFSSQETVTIHWVWPETLSELILEDGNANLRGKSSLCDIQGRKEVVKMFNAHTDWFLFNPVDPSANWSSTFSGTTDEAIANTINTIDTNYSLYSSYYNEADQCIGTHISYVMLDMAFGEAAS